MPFTFEQVFLTALTFYFLVHFFTCTAEISHLKRTISEVPEPLQKKVSLSQHSKAHRYDIARTKLNLLEVTITTIVILALTKFHGIDYLSERLMDQVGDQFAFHWMLPALVAFLFLLVDLPFTWQREFRLREAYGYTRQSERQWFGQFVLTSVVGWLTILPVLWVGLWFWRQSGSQWWIFGWVLFSIYLIFPLHLAQRLRYFFAPSMAQPINNAELVERFNDLGKRAGITIKEIRVTRAEHDDDLPPAFAFGHRKGVRIFIRHNVLQKLSEDNLMAIGAHALARNLSHMYFQAWLVCSLVGLLVFMFLAWLAPQSWFLDEIGFKAIGPGPYYGSLLAFAIVALPVLLFPFKLPMDAFLRHLIFRSDLFALRYAGLSSVTNALIELTPSPMRHSSVTLEFFDLLFSHEPSIMARLNRVKHRYQVMKGYHAASDQLAVHLEWRQHMENVERALDAYNAQQRLLQAQNRDLEEQLAARAKEAELIAKAEAERDLVTQPLASFAEKETIDYSQQDNSLHRTYHMGLIEGLCDLTVQIFKGFKSKEKPAVIDTPSSVSDVSLEDCAMTQTQKTEKEATGAIDNSAPISNAEEKTLSSTNETNDSIEVQSTEASPVVELSASPYKEEDKTITPISPASMDTAEGATARALPVESNALTMQVQTSEMEVASTPENEFITSETTQAHPGAISAIVSDETTNNVEEAQQSNSDDNDTLITEHEAITSIESSKELLIKTEALPEASIDMPQSEVKSSDVTSAEASVTDEEISQLVTLSTSSETIASDVASTTSPSEELKSTSLEDSVQELQEEHVQNESFETIVPQITEALVPIEAVETLSDKSIEDTIVLSDTASAASRTEEVIASEPTETSLESDKTPEQSTIATVVEPEAKPTRKRATRSKTSASADANDGTESTEKSKRTRTTKAKSTTTTRKRTTKTTTRKTTKKVEEPSTTEDIALTLSEGATVATEDIAVKPKRTRRTAKKTVEVASEETTATLTTTTSESEAVSSAQSSDEVVKPKRTRRTTKKKVEEASDATNVATSTGAVENSTESSTQVAEEVVSKPKRTRRTTKKKVEEASDATNVATSTDAVENSTESSTQVAEEVVSKPKRTRRTTKKKVEETLDAASTDTTVSATNAEGETSATEEATVKPKRTRRTTKKKVEETLDATTTVTPNTNEGLIDSADQASEEVVKPKRTRRTTKKTTDATEEVAKTTKKSTTTRRTRSTTKPKATEETVAAVSEEQNA